MQIWLDLRRRLKALLLGNTGSNLPLENHGRDLSPDEETCVWVSVCRSLPQHRVSRLPFWLGRPMVWFSCLHPGSSDTLMGPRAATEVVLSWGGMWRPGLIEQN